MSKLPTVLNFSGNDSAGCAGMAMDVRTQKAMGVHSAAVMTANTAQNNNGVVAINAVRGDAFASQVRAIEALPIQAIKVGLLAEKEHLRVIQDYAQHTFLPMVLDTVFASSSGQGFISKDLIDDLKNTLLPQATLVTPNIDEAEKLTGASIESSEAIIAAADKILSFGAKAVLMKGGHFQVGHAHQVQDYFTDGNKSFWLSNAKIHTTNNRGTGCALASAIASALALGYSIYDAVIIGKMAISQGLRKGYSVDSVYGVVNIDHFPDQSMDLPTLSSAPITGSQGQVFPFCNEPPLGLYPIVDRADWIPTLAKTGVTTIQLRIKDLEDERLAQEIIAAVDYSHAHACRLFINDHWQLAIEQGAYGVHLGQEDLQTADIEKIRAAGLRLGISTHCHYEVARAHYYRPSYMACGPVYHTNTKAMPWVPHGIEGLSYWRRVLDYPLVGIGGIHPERIEAVMNTGVDGVAMITAITEAKDPIATTKTLLGIVS